MGKDYQKTKIYKVYNNENDKFYIGHTITTLSKRLAKHREKHNKCMTKNLCVDLKNCFIVLVEKYPCKDVEEAKKRERFYIEKYQKEGLYIVNKLIPGRTKKQYYEDNKEKIDKQNKEYYEDNKEKINEKKKEYNEKNKEKIKERKKEYREKNQEHIKKQKKEYREKNQEHIKKQKKEKITCECGSIIQKGNNRHKTSKKHIKFLESNN